MFARSTLNNYAKTLPEGEQQAFSKAVADLTGEMHGRVEVLLGSELKKAGLDKHIAALQTNNRWLFLTATDDIRVLSELRYEGNRQS